MNVTRAMHACDACDARVPSARCVHARVMACAAVMLGVRLVRAACMRPHGHDGRVGVRVSAARRSERLLEEPDASEGPDERAERAERAAAPPA